MRGQRCGARQVSGRGRAANGAYLYYQFGYILPDGSFALSGGGIRKGELKLWEVATGNALEELSAEQPKAQMVAQLGHTARVSSVTFSPDGRLALSGSDDNTLKLWDVDIGSSEAETIAILRKLARRGLGGLSNRCVLAAAVKTLPSFTVCNNGS